MTLEEIYKLAIQNHKKNNLEIAKNFYYKVLEIDPIHLGANNNLGALSRQKGESQKAISFFEKVIKINPEYKNAYINLGMLSQQLGENEKAISCYEKVIKINPNHENSYINLGILYHELGENEKSISSYEKVIAINPNNNIAHNNLGAIFAELGKTEQASTFFKKAIEINPQYESAYNNLGELFRLSGENKKAISCYEKVITINPNSLEALINVANLHISQLDDLKKAISSSYKVHKLQQEKLKFTNQSISLFRLKHDVEQSQYLTSKDYKIEGIDKFQKIGDKILSRKENEENENNFDKKILLTPDEVYNLLPYYKSDFIYEPKKISSNFINPDKNWLDVEDEYFNSTNQVIYIDDFLSLEALQELREFSLVSKVWNREYQNRYLGSFSPSGFISQVHLQIAIDLKKKLPKLFGPHLLKQFWGFKYDSTLGRGINIHADFAIHNLNFWITPDEYNNNKNSGGLKVYDTPAPHHWSFKDYNSDKNRIYEFLKDNNANCVNVPYKFNRAVLFNSAYFHETDEIDFKDKYEGRRINNTYLFGNRIIKPQD